MGLFGAAVGAAIGSAVKAASTASKTQGNKGGGSSGSGSSGGGSSGSGGGSSSYKPVGGNTDESIRQANPNDYQAIQQAKADYAAAQARGDTQGMTEANNRANAVRYQYGYTGGKDGSEYNATWTGGGYGGAGQQDGGYSGMYGQAQDTISGAYQDYLAAMEAAAEQERRAKEAAVQQAVGNLNAQKTGVQQAGAQANTAAEQAYMDLINPNSANAEALAARGLSASGLTESSMISAGNTFQNALNSNQRSVNEQLQQIDRDIENARLTGDIATAEALASYKQAVASQGLASAGQLASLQQQGVSDGRDAALMLGQLLGSINGQQTLDGKQVESQIHSQTVERQIQQENLRILLALGYSQAEAELQAQKLSNEGTRLSNMLTQANITGTNLQNQYMQSQLR